MIKTIKHNEMYINLGEKGHFFLSLDDMSIKDYIYGYINTNLTIGCGNEVEYEDNMIMLTSDFFAHEKTEITDKSIIIDYKVKSYPIKVSEQLELVEGLNIVKQVTKVENNGDANIPLSKLSATCVTGIGLGGSRYFDNDNRFIVHYSNCRWQSEGQWQSKTLRELGLWPASKHSWEKCTYRFQSIGSYSTNDYYPLIIIEDTERNECWFFEREGSESWYIDITAFEGYNAQFITVSIGGGDENIGWTYNLKPNEKYSSNTCFYGLIKGTFEEVAKTILDYRRKNEIVHSDKLVMFNDFMNCNWALPNRERLIPLIDVAAEVGCEGFCIDDGWSIPGEWNPLNEKFGNNGLKGIIEYIKEKGMRPGLWFEFERTTYNVAKELGEDVLMHRNGNIVAHYRPKLDLSNSKACKWLMEKIKHVYDMGVRYIKNDQNNDERWGVNYNNESPVEGLRLKNVAYYSFIDEVYKNFPDLIIESCSSGAGRASYDVIKRFSLQSVTDQEDYIKMPSILSGSMIYYGPEKSGSWAYPYPLEHKNISSFEIPKEEIIEQKDGRQTVFNMVSGMSGYLYLSGKIDLADDFNKKLIKESISTYKTYNKTLSDRYPVFPIGLKNMWDNTMNVLGLIDKNNNDMILSVWALGTTKFEVNLTKYRFKNIERLYPIQDFGVEFEYKNGILEITFARDYSAIMFKLN